MRKTLCAAIALAACTTVANSAQAVSDVYAIDLRATPNRLLRFPVNAPANTTISANAGFDGFAMDFDANANLLYGVNGAVAGGPFNFGTIDQTTGNFTSIAALTLPSGHNPSGLSCDPNGTMYLSTSGGANLNNLFTVDLNTGAMTPVAAMSGVAGMLNIDIAISATGQMYGHDIAADNLLLINKATGAATVICPTGQASNFAQGMDFDWETNTLYATIYTGGGTGVFASMNLATGAAQTIVSTTSWNAEMEMAVKAAVPEPASLSLIGLASVGLIRRRRA
jgi:hypothetical protein